MTVSVSRTPTLATSLAAALASAVLFAAPATAGGCYGVECYRRVTTPPIFDTVSEQRLVRPARTIYRTTPPVYDTVSERVMVSPGGRHWQTRYDAYGQLVGCWITTPPRFAVQTRRVLVRQAEVIPETLPPVYASYSRRVLVQPASQQWVPAGGGYGGGFAPVGLRVGSIPDAVGITGASSADVGVGLGFSSGSIYDGY
ncbi:hypothetical protein [Methylobacterium gnaphalii]|uniref:Uncharacterized protein n=1 Tax=Methylobacterium gnaphalii TaxID=1010610 RepID=A0A512JKK2_9HYPH|nr:hypothetical protein [Methylobacterium gnaphalii]GEP10481.1 hypothetical protein MGN01_23260 [Methylobacterium gnaphalii]GJD68937.1 hypothetical protein MMMDOFMJ_1863 [Methylobacterium gnaphalii]GLS47818.1 hypothetical protein GCM10007885_06620 [Methylobacterium gnaphalii]